MARTKPRKRSKQPTGSAVCGRGQQKLSLVPICIPDACFPGHVAEDVASCLRTLVHCDGDIRDLASREFDLNRADRIAYDPETRVTIPVENMYSEVVLAGVENQRERRPP